MRDQVVTPFADSSARSSAVSSPVAGMVSVLTGTNATEFYTGTVWHPITPARYADSTARATAVPTPIDGSISVLTTTDRVDVYNGASWSAVVAPSNGALTAWTPIITQSGNVTFTNNYATYIRTGRWIQGYFKLTVTGSGTAANNVIITGLPATAAQSGHLMGVGQLFDTSAASAWTSFLTMPSTTSLAFRANSVVAGSLFGTVTFTAGLAVGDVLDGTFTYEASADA